MLRKSHLLVLAASFFVISSCGGGSTDNAETTVASDSSLADDNTPSGEAEITAEVLAAQVCTSPLTRMDGEAETFTESSWNCSFAGEQVRIDMFESESQKEVAKGVTRDFYRSMGDNRSLAELPVLCGETWTVGVDFNETRDALIAKLSSAGLSVSTC